ncbi:unnamed protein product [Caenorhabditis angaria]|uniref:Receptor ligand binding region domain-containing protein n=1 Tax=Caenorhabditis angaria TaxID=860376 RepID=A0A9P1J4B9_9PELO|nr:unnamed protein product [Caenorhabditis angaria]
MIFRWILLLLLCSLLSNSEVILITMDANDNFAETVLLHLNISKQFYVDKLRIETVTLNKIVMDDDYNITSVCDSMQNVSFVISICRSTRSIEIIHELAQMSQVPTIQVDFNYWPLPLNFNETKNDVSTTSNSYVKMVMSTLVFQNVITDIFADLNITPNTTVLYDNIFRKQTKLVHKITMTFSHSSTRFQIMERSVFCNTGCQISVDGNNSSKNAGTNRNAQTKLDKLIDFCREN